MIRVCMCVYIYVSVSLQDKCWGESPSLMVTSEFCSLWRVHSEPHIFTLKAICTICVTAWFLRCCVKFHGGDASYWKYISRAQFCSWLKPTFKISLIPSTCFCCSSLILALVLLMQSVGWRFDQPENCQRGWREVFSWIRELHGIALWAQMQA